MNSKLMSQDVLSSTLAYVLGISETHLRVFNFESKREHVRPEFEDEVLKYRAVRQLLNSIIFGHNLGCSNSMRLRGINSDTCTKAIAAVRMNRSTIRQDKSFGTNIQVSFRDAVVAMVEWLQVRNEKIISMFECFDENREVVKFILNDVQTEDIFRDVEIKMDISNYPYMIYLSMCSRVKKSFGIACMFHDDCTLLDTVKNIIEHSGYSQRGNKGSDQEIAENKAGHLKDRLQVMHKPIVIVDGEGIAAPYVLAVLSKLRLWRNEFRINLHTNSRSLINWDEALRDYEHQVFIRDFETQKIKNYNDMEILVQATKAIALDGCTDLIVVSGDVDMLNLEHLSDSVDSIMYIVKSSHTNHRFISAAANAGRDCYDIDDLLSTSDLVQVVGQMI